MRGKNTIIINGRAYDAISGRPVTESTSSQSGGRPAAPAPLQNQKVISDFGPAKSSTKLTTAPASGKKPVPTTERTPHTSHAVHQKPQRSQTLLRQATKRPAPYVAPQAQTQSRSPMISKFAPHPVITAKQPTAPVHKAPAPAARPVITPAAITAPTQITAPSAAQDSRSLKEHLINERLSEAVELKKSEQKSKRKLKLFSKKPRTTHVASMCLALALLGGYLTYVNMPNLSVQVASARSGVAASFPEYRPDGYHFSGPIAYSPGEVTLRFKSNTSNLGYQVQQRASNWDSQAVLDNFVTKESDSYLTYSEQGLTIYTYKNKAAWVNGGVLYTIDGDAPLSSEQVLRIAASL